MFGFNVNKLKPNLKMAVHRIGIVKNKKANAAVSVRREIAALLADGKEEKARIRVEGIIRDDFTVEGYEILELLCDLVAERANLVKTERECPYDMREAVCTLIWAANRTEIPELIEACVKKQLVKKYGQDFAASAVRNADGCVNERVIQKLSVQPPSAYLVVNYMKEIATQFKVDWAPDETAVVDPLAPIPAPTGTSVASAGASGPDYVALYAAGPQVGRLAAALPSAPVEKPVDANAFRVPSLSTSSRLFAPPPPPAPAASHQTLPPPPSYEQHQQHQQPHQHQQPQQYEHHHHRQQSDAYVAPHAVAPARSQPLPPAPAAPATVASSVTPTVAPAVTPAAVRTSSDTSVPDFDELTARFERLRKRQDQDNTSFSF